MAKVKTTVLALAIAAFGSVSMASGAFAGEPITAAAATNSLSSCKVSIPYSSYTYRSREIKPTVTVKTSKGVKLKKGTDYTVSYKNNSDVGTASITITGKGKYTGTVTKKFTIKPLNLNSSYAKISIPYSSYTYTGSSIEPNFNIKFKDGTLIAQGYSTSTNIGTNTSFNSEGSSESIGTSFGTGSWGYSYNSSTSTNIGADTIFNPGGTSGSSVGVSYSHSYYAVSYVNNVNVGVATIIIKGDGETITGTYKKTFVIKPARNKIKSLTSTKGAFKLTWTKATPGATGYQVLYSTDPNFKKNVHSYTSTKLSDLSENFSKVPESGETWYVKVRSFVTRYSKDSSTRYGNYSEPLSIKVK